jgi:hypothetical protein
MYEPSKTFILVLSRVPFETRGSEIHAHLEYIVETETRDSVDEGFCVYILDLALKINNS